MTNKKQLRIWHNSNFGQKPFMKEVSNLKEAKMLLQILADYDLYLGDKITANSQGLEVFVGVDIGFETNDGWTEWEDDYGNDINEVMKNE